MAIYEYQCEDGRVIERECPMGKAPAKVKDQETGKMVPRKWTAPAVFCRYSYMDRVNGNPRFRRGRDTHKNVRKV